MIIITTMCLGMCTMMDLHHSKISAHLEGGLNQQSSNIMTKETVPVITITVIKQYDSFSSRCIANNIIVKSCIHCSIMYKRKNDHVQLSINYVELKWAWP